MEQRIARVLDVFGVVLLAGGLEDAVNPQSRAVVDRLPLSFSADAKHLAVMRFHPKWLTANEVVLLDLADQTKTVSIACQCIAMAFSPDGKRLVTVGDVGVFLWDVATGAQIASSR